MYLLLKKKTQKAVCSYAKDSLDYKPTFCVWYKYFYLLFLNFFLLESYCFICLKEVCIFYTKKHLENNCKVEFKSVGN